MTDAPTPLPAITPRERAERRLSEWRRELAQVERERSAMKWVPVVATPLAVALWFAVSWTVGAATIGFALLTWGLGVYMTTVRRWEFMREIADAEAALRSDDRPAPDVRVGELREEGR
jgi:hypothetical protein